MPPLANEDTNNVAFRGLVLNTETPEQMEKKAAELQASADAARKRQNEVLQAAREKVKLVDMDLLEKHKADLQETEDLLNLPGKLGLEDLKKLQHDKTVILADIRTIQKKYGIDQDEPDQKSEVILKPTKALSAIPTIAKVTALVVACWAIVFGSGELIMEAYPNAAVYNVVSFQKVLFAFSVFMGGIASVIVSLAIFFPGLAKYFNPFNRDQLDFFNDFKILSEWQRVLISVVLFCALFFAFVMTVSGKLD